MEFKVPVKILRILSSGENPKHEEFADYFSRWKDDWDVISIDSNTLSDDHINNIIETANRYTEQCSALLRRFSSYKKLLKKGDSIQLKRLLDVPDSMVAYARKFLPNNIVYIQDEYGRINPYVLTKCEYIPRDRDYPPSVYFSFKATKQGKEVHKSFSIYTGDLSNIETIDGKSVSKGKSIQQILGDHKLLPESDLLNVLHEENLEKYRDLMSKTGSVFIGSDSGKATISYIDRWGDSSTRESNFYFKDNVSPKVVLDFDGIYSENSNEEERQDDKIIMSNFSGNMVKLPIHTYGDTFHLEEHVWISMHVSSLEPYESKGKSLMDKLVLSNGDKDLIKILMEMSKMRMEDIIEGKTGGSFIIATGVPGTGKTLTAEVFSETIEKPLYKVQCSQLGLNVDEVEKNLKQVLSRASRWGAILLIDEADVYVRARGSDINQNAIVGTFLRTLEYFTGILFMTSNMGTEIDDAIMSRATAHLQYGAPDDDERSKIWKILSIQFGIQLSTRDIEKLCVEYPTAVGRDIKAMLKLGKMYAEGKGIDCTVKVIKSISGFVPNVNKKITL